MSTFATFYQKLMDSTQFGRLYDYYVPIMNAVFKSDFSFQNVGDGVVGANGSKYADRSTATVIQLPASKPLRVLLSDGTTVILDVSSTALNWGASKLDITDTYAKWKDKLEVTATYLHFDTNVLDVSSTALKWKDKLDVRDTYLTWGVTGSNVLDVRQSYLRFNTSVLDVSSTALLWKDKLSVSDSALSWSTHLSVTNTTFQYDGYDVWHKGNLDRNDIDDSAMVLALALG